MPSFGPDDRSLRWWSRGSLSFRRTVVSRENVRRRPCASVNIDWTPMSAEKRPYRMKARAEAQEQTRLRITESAVALHEELGPARTSMSADRRARRRAPLDALPLLPRRGRAVRARARRTGARENPPPDLGSWAAIETPPSACARARRAVRVSTRAARRCSRTCARRAARAGASQRAARPVPRLPRCAIRTILLAGRGLRGSARAPHARGDRPRAGVPDVALARARAGARQRRARSTLMCRSVAAAA